MTLTLLLLAGACAAAGFHLERDGRPGWAWAWAALLGSGGLLLLSAELSILAPFSAVLAALFPVLLLRSAFQFADRPPAFWLPLVALGLGAVRAALRTAQLGTAEAAVSLVAEFSLIAFAVFVASRAPERTRAMIGGRWIVPGLVLCLGMEVVSASSRLVGGEVPISGWILVGVPVAFTQLFSSIGGAHEARERALRASEQRFRQLSERSRDVIAEVDASGRLTYVSPNVRTLLGFEPAALVGRMLTEVIAGLEAQWPDALVDGKPDREALAAHRLAGTVHRVRDSRGTWHWLSTEAVNYRAADGGQRALSLSRDITEQVRAAEERRQLEAQLHQAQKLESLGVLAGGIAHDFNNLLVGILGSADLALDEVRDNPKLREFLEDILSSSERASQLTRQLMAYAGHAALVMEPVELSSLLREMAQLVRTSVPKTARLAMEAKADVWVQGDPTQLQQVMMNLITNAGESLGGRSGTVALRTGAMRADRGYLAECQLSEGLEPQEYGYFEVSDDGVGIAPDVLSRIYDPFFTTKAQGRGLGLAATLGIVRRHRGALRVESQPGRGTVVRVLLPPTEAGIQAEDATAGGARDASRRSILVVDDEPSVLRLVENMLVRLGHTVLTAASGREAVRVYRERPAEVDAIMLDLTMPEMDGEQVFREIRAIRSDVPVLLMSGHSERQAGERLAETRNVAFLQKPFRLASLSARLEVLLGDEPD